MDVAEKVELEVDGLLCGGVCVCVMVESGGRWVGGGGGEEEVDVCGAFLGTTWNTAFVSHAGSLLKNANGTFYRDVMSLWLSIGMMLLRTPGCISLGISALQHFCFFFLPPAFLTDLNQAAFGTFVMSFDIFCSETWSSFFYCFHLLCSIFDLPFRNRMADVPEQMTWQGGLWIGIFVNRDYCRPTSDRSPVTYRPERMSSLAKSRNVVCRDLLDVAFSEFMNATVSRQFDRGLATKASMMDMPVDSRALEGWEATLLLQKTLVNYFRRRHGDMKAAEIMLLDSLEWFQEQRHWEDWLRKHEVEHSPQHKALFHKNGAGGPSGFDKLDVLVLYVKADIQDTVGTMRSTCDI